MLRFEAETLGYGGTDILTDLTFAMGRGERVVLVGRSGAGKSTLLSAAYRRLAAAMPDIALVPQDAGLVPQLSVFHNIYMGRLDAHSSAYNLANLVWPFPRERAAIAPVLEAVGLAAFERRRVETLSGGQKQRTALARAFFRGGPTLLGDEPVSAVDERQAAALVGEIAKRFETSLLALHDVALARRFATRIVGISGGRILFDKPPADLSGNDLDGLYGR